MYDTSGLSPPPDTTGFGASIQEAGNRVTVLLPPAEDAGFAVEDVTVAHPALNPLVITKRNQDGTQLADEIVEMRCEQTEVVEALQKFV